MYSGALGTVENVSDKRILIRTDEGPRITIDPRLHREWDHGYAGTVYRGQGKTQTRVYALYDHAYAWSASTSYVALTRHREELSLHVSRDLADDAGALVGQMSRREERALSISFQTEEDVALARKPANEIVLQAAQRLAEIEAAQLAQRQQIALQTNQLARDLGDALERRAADRQRRVREDNDLALQLAKARQQPAVYADAALARALDLAIKHAQQPHVSLKQQRKLWQRALDAVDTANTTHHSVGGPPDAWTPLAEAITQCHATIEAGLSVLHAADAVDRASPDDLLPACEKLAAAAQDMENRLKKPHQHTQFDDRIPLFFKGLAKMATEHRNKAAELKIAHIEKITAPSYSPGISP